jgi:predicted acyltransferase
MGSTSPESGRLVSLDQFRGYTVLGMFLVNFCASFVVVPAVLKHHHTYFSYADSIMPQFFLAVGFAYRLTLLRRIASQGKRAAYVHVIRRNLGLILVGLVVHGLGRGVADWKELTGPTFWEQLGHGLKRPFFQTLTHIGVTSLWVLPVIAAGPRARIAFAAGSGLLHLALSFAFNYTWVNTNPVGIDGGPLGFLTWTIPLLAGSLACDAMNQSPWRAAWQLLGWGTVLMILGYGLSCLNRITPPNEASGGLMGLLVEPPFVPPTHPVNVWTMSQRSGSLTYLVFGAGFSLAVLAVFVGLCDVWRFRWSYLNLLGQNALIGYIIHDMVGEVVKPWVPKDAPLWYVAAGFALFLGIITLFLRHLEKHRLYLRL